MKDSVKAAEKLKKNVFLRVMDKVNHFKTSGTSRIRIAEYMVKRNSEDTAVYRFGIEKDELCLKVLCHILYEELEGLIKNYSTQDRLRQIQAEQEKGVHNKVDLDKVMEMVETMRKEERVRYEAEIRALNGQIETFEGQVKRKNMLINRLFTDKNVFDSYWDSLSNTLVDIDRFVDELYAHLRDSDSPVINHTALDDGGREYFTFDKIVAGIHERINKAAEFVKWAQDYHAESDQTYLNDPDWIARKEHEKSDLKDEMDLSRHNVKDFKAKKLKAAKSTEEGSQNEHTEGQSKPAGRRGSPSSEKKRSEYGSLGNQMVTRLVGRIAQRSGAVQATVQQHGQERDAPALLRT